MKTCLHCTHGSFRLAAQLVGRTKQAMGCTAAKFPDSCTVQPFGQNCRNGLFEATDTETVTARLKWIKKEQNERMQPL